MSSSWWQENLHSDYWLEKPTYFCFSRVCLCDSVNRRFLCFGPCTDAAVRLYSLTAAPGPLLDTPTMTNIWKNSDLSMKNSPLLIQWGVIKHLIFSLFNYHMYITSIKIWHWIFFPLSFFFNWYFLWLIIGLFCIVYDLLHTCIKLMAAGVMLGNFSSRGS